MPVKRKYTDEQIVIAVANSISISQILKKLGLRPTGGNYKNIQMYMEKLQIDRSHLAGQGYLKGKTHNWAKTIPLEEILIENSKYTCLNNLKRRLIKAGLLVEQCSHCGITEWLGQKLSLHLHHKNGKCMDHRLVNIELVCPNCHSITDNYCAKNKNKGTK